MGQAAPRASVIMPVHNRARLARLAIDSVLAQSYEDFELLVVDDGSTDEVPALLTSYGTRLRTISRARGGPAAARNTAIRESRGGLLALVDSDDLAWPDYLASQIGFLDANPHVEIAACAWRRIGPDGSQLPQFGFPTVSGNAAEQWIRYGGGFPVPMITPGTVFRRSVADRIGLFDEGLETWEDVDFWIRAAKAGIVFGSNPKLLMEWRRTPDSVGQDREASLRSLPRYLDHIFVDGNLPPALAALRPATSAGYYCQLGLAFLDAFVKTGSGQKLEYAAICLQRAARFHPGSVGHQSLVWDHFINACAGMPGFRRDRLLATIGAGFHAAEGEEWQRQVRRAVESRPAPAREAAAKNAEEKIPHKRSTWAWFRRRSA